MGVVSPYEAAVQAVGVEDARILDLTFSLGPASQGFGFLGSINTF